MTEQAAVSLCLLLYGSAAHMVLSTVVVPDIMCVLMGMLSVICSTCCLSLSVSLQQDRVHTAAPESDLKPADLLWTAFGDNMVRIVP